MLVILKQGLIHNNFQGSEACFLSPYAIFKILVEITIAPLYRPIPRLHVVTFRQMIPKDEGKV